LKFIIFNKFEIFKNLKIVISIKIENLKLKILDKKRQENNIF